MRCAKYWAYACLILLAGCSREHNHPIVVPYDGPVGSTNSMVPTIHPGQRIHVDNVPFDQIVVGDIIVYWESARELSICHRVLAISHGADGRVALVTRGDNNNLERDWHLVTPDNYLGKVTHIYPL